MFKEDSGMRKISVTLRNKTKGSNLIEMGAARGRKLKDRQKSEPWFPNTA